MPIEAIVLWKEIACMDARANNGSRFFIRIPTLVIPMVYCHGCFKPHKEYEPPHLVYMIASHYKKTWWNAWAMKPSDTSNLIPRLVGNLHLVDTSNYYSAHDSFCTKFLEKNMVQGRDSHIEWSKAETGMTMWMQNFLIDAQFGHHFHIHVQCTCT